MPQAFYILFGAVFTFFTALALGRFLLRRLPLPLYRQEEVPFAFLAGSACLSLLVFLLAALHLVYKGVFLALGALVILAGLRRAARLPAFEPIPRMWRAAFLLIAAPGAVLAFFHAMAPEMSPDGSSYHLGLVARYYRERGFPAITTSIYASLSQGVEMLFLFAYAFGRHSAAALTHLSFLLILPWLMLAYGRRFGFTFPASIAALFVFLSPVVAVDAASAYNDVAVAAVLFGAYYLVQIWDQTRDAKLLILIGVLAGFAFAAKYTAFLIIPYALGWLLWRLRGSFWRPALVVCAVSAVFIAPWMIKNAVVVANPVSPFFNSLFPNPYVRVSFEEEYRHHMRNYDGLRSKADIPLEVTARGHVLCGLLGPLFLLSPLALLAWRRPHGKRLLLATIIFASVYATNIGTRFLIPALPFLALSMALAFSFAPRLLLVLAVAHAISAWPPVMKYYCATYAWRLDRVLLRQALRLESEDGFLARKWPGYAVARMIEHFAPPDGRALSFNQIAEAYTTRQIIVPYQSSFGALAGGILWTPLVADYQPLRRMEFRFPEQSLRIIRLRQTLSNSNDHYILSEVRLFRSDVEIPRHNRWRLRASPNPWDVQLAFDNSPVTAWGSWERVHPGMFVEIDLVSPEPVNSVVIENPRGQSSGAIRLETEPQVPSPQPVETELPPPMDLRREATATLRSLGLTHLVIHENDFGANDFHSRQDDWNFSFLGEQYGFRLYAIR